MNPLISETEKEPDMIRKAHKDDVKRITQIYNEVVANSAATFDLEEKSLEDRAAWMEEHKGNHPLLVYETNGSVVGYASLSSYREKKAFDATVELSVYLVQRQGDRHSAHGSNSFGSKEPKRYPHSSLCHHGRK